MVPDKFALTYHFTIIPHSFPFSGYLLMIKITTYIQTGLLMSSFRQ